MAVNAPPASRQARTVSSTGISAIMNLAPNSSGRGTPRLSQRHIVPQEYSCAVATPTVIIKLMRPHELNEKDPDAKSSAAISPAGQLRLCWLARDRVPP